MCIGAIALLIPTLLHVLNLYVLVIPALIYMYGNGIIFPTYFAKGIELFPEASGAANAVMGSMFIIGAGIMTGLASLLKDSNALPLALSFVLS